MFTLIYLVFKLGMIIVLLPFNFLGWMIKLFMGIFGWLFIGLGLFLDDGRY